VRAKTPEPPLVTAGADVEGRAMSATSRSTESSAMETGARTVDIGEALDFAQKQVRRLIDDAPDRVATYTRDGRWVFEADPWAPSWTGGFFTGMMWVFADLTGDRWWAEQAEKYSVLLEGRKSDPTTHDVGFVFEPSWGRWYDRDGSARARDVLIEAGRTMARRLQRPGGYLCTWVDPGSTFIDVMMNVGIIFRAAEYSGDDALRDVALTHCRTSRRYLVRGDGSTVHEGWFDVETGEFLRGATHQGWRSDSTWARGQTWAIYGFTTAYRHTGDSDMLDTARRVADYYMRYTPEHGVPPNDWMDPSPETPYEASAAAIAAAGLQHLADALGAHPDAPRYRRYALRILQTLRSTEFIAVDVDGWQGILRHATYHLRNGLAIDESVMWGEYYFVEALALAARSELST
jgi:unsaturated chondroitin disaccharide hydrolase